MDLEENMIFMLEGCMGQRYSTKQRADKNRNISGHLNANRHGRHVAESGAILRDKISSGFTVKIAVHPIKKYSIYPRRKFQ